MVTTSEIGIVFGSLTPPEALPGGAALAERLGFGALWFSEDCFFTGGLSGLTQLLAATETIPAGLGLAGIMTRHPAILAMEVSALARTYPGRVRAGIGLGNTGWLDQMGLRPDRPLTALAETTDALRDLLSGKTVNRKTTAHTFNDIRLDFPPDRTPEIWLGAVNPRALRLAGEKADGILLSALTGTSYLHWARTLLPIPAPPITAFALTAIDDDPAAAREAVRPAVSFFLQAEAHTALVGKSHHGTAVRARLATLAPGEPLPIEDPWIDEYAIAGTPAQVRAKLRGLLDAGATSIALWLFPPDRQPEQLHRLATEVLDT
ncbi:LLM class flavin-dependent oxidoreductase [Nocardia inohanensis]|uniref:LLM class flavin-dependent oxidoreductase n=1 Tax=Nocardia inohanensis TaxID=209246 RepID=UPI00082B458F|nr:LLM class flavin-dependent oxidoreductase [Nocardia inohanensis]